MTLAIDQSTVRGALYGVAKQYPGGVRQLATDMDMPESTLYAKLRGEKGYPLHQEEIDEILNFARIAEVPHWDRPLQVQCYAHGLLPIPMPNVSAGFEQDNLKQVSVLMSEVADIANSLADATNPKKANGKLINSNEWKNINQACNEAMRKIAETREQCRAQWQGAKDKGLVR